MCPLVSYIHIKSDICILSTLIELVCISSVIHVYIIIKLFFPELYSYVVICKKECVFSLMMGFYTRELLTLLTARNTFGV